MIKIMFICHGNICRSPMAEFILKKLVAEQHLENAVLIASSATSTEELGNPVYPPAKRKLAEHGISCEGKYAVQLKPSDYDKYDFFFVMDEHNLFYITRIFPADPEHKVHKLLKNQNVADPWYTGDFEKAYQDIYKGCSALLVQLKEILHEQRS